MRITSILMSFIRLLYHVQFYLSVGENMNVRSFLSQNKIIITDGATGTYFSELTGMDVKLCEKYNVTSPDVIRHIHNGYIKAGSTLLRTNTFFANSYALGISRDELKSIIINGYNIASECAGGKAIVCADVSAVYGNSLSSSQVLDEYKFIVDTFLSCNAETFIFETLPSLQTVLPAIDYILSQKPDAEIITSFTLMPDNHTRSGLSAKSLLADILQNKHKLTMIGLNCGSGAVQMFRNAAPFLSYIHENTDLFTMVMPNAGYPSIENQRTVFTSTPEYFAEQTAVFKAYGVSAIGGCCGTNPEHIRQLAIELSSEGNTHQKSIIYPTPKQNKTPSASSQLSENKFILAAELDPPNTSDITRLISAAKTLKESGVNIITVSDSPLGHAKMDSVLCSSRIKREVNIETLPHICCRDKNINALRSSLLGAHSDGIRAVLAVTGDPVSEIDRGVIKPVFNIDSTRLMELINSLNEDVFSDSPIVIGGAFDPAPRKAEYSLKRLDKKMKKGASFVLTQPVFSEAAIESIDRARETGAKVLVGIMPMVSYRNASFMKNEVPGMTIPDELVHRFRPDMTREESTEVGIEIAVELARMLKSHADGFYFITPFNRAEVISRIISSLHLEISQ